MNAIPWYRSRILQGLLTIVVSQVIARITEQYHINFAVLGLDANSVVNWLMDLISAGAVYWSTHARVAPAVPIPPVVTLTKSDADAINSKEPPK